MLKKYLAIVIGITLPLLSVNVSSEIESKALLLETFEVVKKSGLAALLTQKDNLSVVDGEGVDGSKALKAIYVGSDIGSERLVARYRLPEFSDEMTLVYDLKFDKNFQFVKGGKLHGFGPENPVTGGGKTVPAGWSARLLFKREGRLGSYLYTQNKTNKYGVEAIYKEFKFEKERYYAISFHVKINDVGKDNGYAHVYINGRKLIEQNEIRFRSVGGKESLINEFLFNTFHGGNTAAWAPKDKYGNYISVFAYFDNISVYQGLYIRLDAGL